MLMPNAEVSDAIGKNFFTGRGPAAVLTQQLLTDELNIAYDTVGTEVAQVACLRRWSTELLERLRQHHIAAPVASRVQYQHVLVF